MKEVKCTYCFGMKRITNPSTLTKVVCPACRGKGTVQIVKKQTKR